MKQKNVLIIALLILILASSCTNKKIDTTLRNEDGEPVIKFEEKTGAENNSSDTISDNKVPVKIEYQLEEKFQVEFTIDLNAIKSEILKGKKMKDMYLGISMIVPIDDGYLAISNESVFEYEKPDQYGNTISTPNIYVMKLNKKGDLVHYDEYQGYYQYYSYPPRVHKNQYIYIFGTGKKEYTLIYNLQGEFVREEKPKLFANNNKTQWVHNIVEINGEYFVLMNWSPMDGDVPMMQGRQFFLRKLSGNDEILWTATIRAKLPKADMFDVYGMHKNNKDELLVYGRHLASNSSEKPEDIMYDDKSYEGILIAKYNTDGFLQSKIEVSIKDADLSGHSFYAVDVLDQQDKVLFLNYASSGKRTVEIKEIDPNTGKVVTIPIFENGSFPIEAICYQNIIYILDDGTLYQYDLDKLMLRKFDLYCTHCAGGFVSYFIEDDTLKFPIYMDDGRIQVVTIKD